VLVLACNRPRRIAVASCAFLVWEMCVTFGDEVDFLSSCVSSPSVCARALLTASRRRPRLQWTKAAYVVLRYYALALIVCVLAPPARKRLSSPVVWAA
jgi:hypothetical protein